MIKFMAPAVLALALLAGGCGDDSDAIPIGPGGPQNPEDIADDILADLADGSFDEDDLSDLMESAQNTAESLGGSGSGTVNINGDTIEFTSEICILSQGDFTIEGPGATGDGTPVWVSISQSTDTREELLEFFDESMIQTLYGDADPIVDSSLSLNYGQTDLFGSADDDLPQFNATTGVMINPIEMTLDGDSATGSGEAGDFNASAGDFGDAFPFTFTAGCS